MKTQIIVATAIAGLVATAAVAAPSNSAKADASAQAGASASPASPQTDAKRYCIVETPTGSRLPRKQCQTREQWASEGVDFDALRR